MTGLRSRLVTTVTAMVVSAAALVALGGTANALSNPANPVLAFDRIITSHPFSGAPGNAIDVEGLGSVPSDNAMWVADDNGDRIWEIDATTGAYRRQIRAVDFQTRATEVGSGRLCSDPTLVDPTFTDVNGVPNDTAAFECHSRTDDLESIVYDPTADVLYVTTGNCCNAGLPAIYIGGVAQSHYPYHPAVYKLVRDGSGDFQPASWHALAEGEDPTAAGWRPGVGMYYGKSNKIRPYVFGSGPGAQITLAVVDIVGVTFTDANTAFVTTATPNTASGRTTATSDSTIHRFAISGSTWTENTGWKFPLAGIGQACGPVDDDGMIDARDLAIVSSGGVDKFYVSDGYDSRSSGDHPIYVYTLRSAPTGSGPSWHYSTLNGSCSGVSNDRFANGNSLMQYNTQPHDFYANSTRAALSHSWFDGVRWNAETLDGDGGTNGRTTNSVGTYVEALQYGTTLQLFYSDATAHDLRHAWWDGARWTFESLDGAGGTNGRTTDWVGGGTIAVQQYRGQLHVLYPDDTAHKLRHAWWSGTRWNFENLDSSISIPSAGSFVATTQFGTSYQVLYKASGNNLRHAWYDGAWHGEMLDGTGGLPGSTTHPVGDYVTVLPFGTQLDAIYQDTSNSSLRHAWWNGVRWSFETLDGAGGAIPGHTDDHVGAHIAALPYAGGLHLWYQDTSTGALRHAWYAAGWHVEVLDGSGSTKPGASSSSNTGLFTSVLLNGGQLQLTYFDKANADRLQRTWWG